MLARGSPLAGGAGRDVTAHFLPLGCAAGWRLLLFHCKGISVCGKQGAVTQGSGLSEM